MHPPRLRYDGLDSSHGPAEHACGRLEAATIETIQFAE